MVLLKSEELRGDLKKFLNLHSTMVLLKWWRWTDNSIRSNNLHSTMVLLKFLAIVSTLKV